jgi:SPP1 family predicted phage head-tail adaptor
MAEYTLSLDELRTRITFQEPTVTVDAGGAQVPSWANISSVPTVWARWINVHGEEAVSNEALKSAQRATVTVRYRNDLVSTWRVAKGSEYWQIISIDQVQGRNHWIEMVVERVKGTV